MQRQKLRSNPRKKFGHRNGRSSCAHSIGKFFLCYIVLFSFETSATGSPGNYLYVWNLFLSNICSLCKNGGSKPILLLLVATLLGIFAGVFRHTFLLVAGLAILPSWIAGPCWGWSLPLEIHPILNDTDFYWEILLWILLRSPKNQNLMFGGNES